MTRGTRLWSISELATELAKNHRTMTRALADVPSDGVLKGGHKGWTLLTALDALRRYSEASDQLTDRARGRLHESAQLCDQIEGLATEIDAGLRRLRNAPPSQRLKMLKSFGKKVGALDRSLGRSIVAQGLDATAVLGPFRDQLVGRLVAEITQLL